MARPFSGSRSGDLGCAEGERRRGLVVFALLLAAALLTGCATSPAAPSTVADAGAEDEWSLVEGTAGDDVGAEDGSEGQAAPAESPRTGEALDALGGLAVKGRAPMTGYSREAFGPAWLDADRNGCDTRNDVLGRDLAAVVHRPGTSGCVVERGVLADPYTGQQIEFVRGAGPGVDIDHVVALANVWVSGGWRWDLRQRAAIANDPVNLAAVTASANRQKGAANAASWLPAHKAHRCAYVARQVGVKRKYGLSVTPSERDAIARVLARCPDQRLPEDSGAATRVDHDLRDPSVDEAVAEDASAGEGPAEAPVTTRFFANCDAARAAGAAPVRRGDAGYGAHLDRDGDGVACE